MKKWMSKLVSALCAVVLCISMTACAPFTLDRAEEKMEDAGYSVLAYEGEEEEGLVGGIIATKMDGILNVDTLTALYFSSILDAKDYYDELDDEDAKWQGKWVFWGSEEAMEDFTKLF